MCINDNIYFFIVPAENQSGPNTIRAINLLIYILADFYFKFIQERLTM